MLQLVGEFGEQDRRNVIVTSRSEFVKKRRHSMCHINGERNVRDASARRNVCSQLTTRSHEQVEVIGSPKVRVPSLDDKLKHVGHQELMGINLTVWRVR